MSKEIYLVIGGSGFLGRHLVDKLLARGDSVAIFDIIQRFHDVPFYSGDISEETQVSHALQKSGATCIFHVASPPHGIDDPALYWKVNVDGTKAVIDAAIANGIRKLVFTSSAGVVFNGEDLINIDERLPPPEKSMDAYNESKAKGEEIVLAANGKGGLLTVALRPSGIFGPGDRQVMHGLYQVYTQNQTHFQIGDNTNLFDWTYVTNVAHAHILAADKLAEALRSSPAPSTPSSSAAKTYLPGISLTTGTHRIPTSEARPLGPYVDPPPNAEVLESKFTSPDPNAQYSENSHPRPVVRSRFDPMSDQALARAREPLSKPGASQEEAPPPPDPLQVAGQVFFITNGEPLYFWDLPRSVWSRLRDAGAGSSVNHVSRRRITFPREVGLVLAYAAEWWGWLIGKEPAFTRFRVKFSCVNRYHNIEKARRVLGYEPEIGVEEGVSRMVEWWLSEHGKS